MSISWFGMVPWLLASLVIGALHITSAVILSKERHLGAWLMLAGSVVMLLGQIAQFAIQIAIASGSVNVERIHLMAVTSSVSNLGGLTFAVGLLLHALYQRAKIHRVAELEAIIASMQNR
jgi:hypothetical protein